MPDFLQKKTHFEYDFLDARGCLNILTAEEKNELVSNKTDLEFSAGEIIVKRGVLVSNVLYVTEGLVKIEMSNDNKLYTVGLIQPHCFVGIVCCFAFKKFDFTATALENSKISFIDIDVFEKFIKTNPDFSLALIKHMSGVSNGLLHRMARLSQKNIDGALSILLLEFSEIYNSKSYTLPVLRKELADILGYSKESVINTLSKFNRERIIDVLDRNIEILDISRLKKISKLG
ncbi:Crp/Fnr family transcriptional regulator [uncultured Lutibacter sp.]|uniref:Crp/Fnr family transcriptional regulator n=1 Tax=uncultured Lutibacter sp. TaxID=437739 RepID=UPI002631DDE8|nr:Crp/Fnr family transcriptional regulator [uncultured Lutibacter sp.]